MVTVLHALKIIDKPSVHESVEKSSGSQVFRAIFYRISVSGSRAMRASMPHPVLRRPPIASDLRPSDLFASVLPQSYSARRHRRTYACLAKYPDLRAFDLPVDCQ